MRVLMGRSLVLHDQVSLRAGSKCWEVDVQRKWPEVQEPALVIDLADVGMDLLDVEHADTTPILNHLFVVLKELRIHAIRT